jgi:hypothetical protein
MKKFREALEAHIKMTIEQRDRKLVADSDDLYDVVYFNGKLNALFEVKGILEALEANNG